MNFAMATLGLKEMGKFLWEGREKSLPSWLSQFSFDKVRQPVTYVVPSSCHCGKKSNIESSLLKFRFQFSIYLLLCIQSTFSRLIKGQHYLLAFKIDSSSVGIDKHSVYVS